MELEQLVSFVRYQRGQKQGWDTLDEVLTVVLESQEKVAANEQLSVKLTQDVEILKGSLVTLDETRLAKLSALEAELADRRADDENASRNAKVALEQAISALSVQRASLEEATQLANQKHIQAEAELAEVTQQVTHAKADLADAVKAKADLKASL